MKQPEKNVVKLLDEVLFNRFPLNFVNLVIALSAIAVAFLAACIMLLVFLFTLI